MTGHFGTTGDVEPDYVYDEIKEITDKEWEGRECDVRYCLSCGGSNSCNAILFDSDGSLEEAKTQCLKCGHENYWERGRFKYLPKENR